MLVNINDENHFSGMSFSGFREYDEKWCRYDGSGGKQVKTFIDII